MDDYWVWCGSVIKADNPGEDGRYHMFASRWPRRLPMSPHWLFSSEVVRASSDTPEGPYTFQEVVLPRRGPAFWDGMNTHNPTVKKVGQTYLLYYFGATYDHEAPDPLRPETWVTSNKHDTHYLPTWNRKKTGLAVSQSILGPWKRLDHPILDSRPDCWDATAITNPAPCIMEDGRVFMLYKSRRPGGDKNKLELGVAYADRFDGPYRRLSNEPIFQFDDPKQHVEDPYLWFEGGKFNCIMKDMTGGLTGEWGAGIHATSDDCIHWRISQPPKAWSRTVRWDDGTTSYQANFERPQLLIQDGKPTHLFAATGDGAKPWHFSHTWNMCIPLRTD